MTAKSLTFDYERADEVLSPLYEAFMNRKMLFTNIDREIDAPQRRYVPDKIELKSLTHCRWLFFAAMTDRREVSERVYQTHKQLWETRPGLYTPEVTAMPPKRLWELLRQQKLGSPGQSAKYWPINARILFEVFDGDPLELYRQNGTIDAIVAKKKALLLPGFGPKILSLLALFYNELGLLELPPDAFPVDVHVQRIALSTGVLHAEGKVLNESLEKVLRPGLCRLCQQKGWSPLELSHAMWFLGSLSCSGCYRDRAKPFTCPVYEHCSGTISSETYFRRGFWDIDAPRHRKGGSMELSLDFGPLFERVKC